MTRTQATLLALSVLILSALSAAQVPTGTPPFSTIADGLDSINIQNLNAHYQIPVVHKSGRGVPFNYDLTYDSSIWYPVTSGSTKSWKPVNGWGWGGGLQGMSLAGQITFRLTPFTCGSPYPTGGGQY